MIILKKLSMDMKVLLGIVVILFVSVCLYLYLVKPYDVDIVYNGVKFQSGNMNTEESINIKIKGKYVRGFFGRCDEFSGKILIDDIGLDYSANRLGFDSHNMVIQEFKPTVKGVSGMLFITEKFDKIGILISERDKGFSFSFEDGNVISAPSENREESVKIFNEIMRKRGSNNIIK